MNLSTAIKKTIAEFGLSVISEFRFLNILADYGAFNNERSARIVLKELIGDGYFEKVLQGIAKQENPDILIKRISHDIIDRYPYREDVVLSIVEGIVNAGFQGIVVPEISTSIVLSSVATSENIVTSFETDEMPIITEWTTFFAPFPGFIFGKTTISDLIELGGKPLSLTFLDYYCSCDLNNVHYNHVDQDGIIKMFQLDEYSFPIWNVDREWSYDDWISYFINKQFIIKEKEPLVIGLSDMFFRAYSPDCSIILDLAFCNRKRIYGFDKKRKNTLSSMCVRYNPLCKKSNEIVRSSNRSVYLYDLLRYPCGYFPFHYCEANSKKYESIFSKIGLCYKNNTDNSHYYDYLLTPDESYLGMLRIRQIDLLSYRFDTGLQIAKYSLYFDPYESNPGINRQKAKSICDDIFEKLLDNLEKYYFVIKDREKSEENVCFLSCTNRGVSKVEICRIIDRSGYMTISLCLSFETEFYYN